MSSMDNSMDIVEKSGEKGLLKFFKSRGGIICISMSVVLLVVVTIVGILHVKKSVVQDRIYSIHQLQADKNYSEAMNLAEKLPDDIRPFYEKYLYYKDKINDYNGTEEELVNLLNNAYEALNNIELPEDSGKYDVVLIGDLVEFEHDYENFSDEYARVTRAKVWYPKYYEVVTEYYSEYIHIARLNRSLFANPYGKDYVIIDQSTYAFYDKEIKKLYDSTIEELEKVMSSIPSNDEKTKEFVQEQIEKINQTYQDYCRDLSLSAIYDISSDMFSIEKDIAKHNLTAYEETLQSVFKTDTLDEIISGSFDVYETEEYLNIRDSVSELNRDLLKCIWSIFPDVTPSVDGSTWVPVEKVIEDLLK